MECVDGISKKEKLRERMRMYGRIEVEDYVRDRWNKVREDSIKVNMGGVTVHPGIRSRRGCVWPNE